MSACIARHPRALELEAIPGESAACIYAAGHGAPHSTCWGRLWRDGDPALDYALLHCAACDRELTGKWRTFWTPDGCYRRCVNLAACDRRAQSRPIS